MARCVGGMNMLGASSIPSRSVTPPLTEASRSRRQTRVPSSTSVCAPAPTSPVSTTVRDLERIYLDSSDVEEQAPRRWGVWQGATLATEAVCSGTGGSADRLPDSQNPLTDAINVNPQSGCAEDDFRRSSVDLPSSRSFVTRAERPAAASSPSQECSEQDTTSMAFMSRLRNKRRSAWGKVRASISPTRTDNAAATSKHMAETDAWVIIQKWRRIVEANFDPSVPAPVSKFVQLAEVLDVAKLEPTQLHKTVEATRMSLPEMLQIQAQRQDALFSLMHIHSGLVFKVAAHLKGSMAGLPDLEDVAMEGMVQLRLCIWTFNDTLGNTFATHAWIQLEGRLKAALYGKDRVMALPLSEMTQRRRVWAAHSAVQAERRSGGAGAGDIAEGITGLDAAMISAIARRAAVDDPTATRILSGSDSHAEIFPDGANFDTGDAWEVIASGSHVAGGSAGSTDPEDDGERAWGEEEGAEDAELLRVLDVPELRSTVEDVLNRLPSVQGEVIAYKYGLRGDGPLMRKEIAERLGFKSASLVQYHHTKAMKSFANVLQYMHKFEK